MENKEYCAFLDSDIKEEKTVDFVRRKIATEEKIYDLIKDIDFGKKIFTYSLSCAGS